MSKEIRAEAMYIGKSVVYALIRRAGQRISCYKRGEITAATEALLPHRPDIIQAAWDICKMHWEAKRAGIDEYDNDLHCRTWEIRERFWT